MNILRAQWELNSERNDDLRPDGDHSDEQGESSKCGGFLDNRAKHQGLFLVAFVTNES